MFMNFMIHYYRLVRDQKIFATFSDTDTLLAIIQTYLYLYTLYILYTLH